MHGGPRRRKGAFEESYLLHEQENDWIRAQKLILQENMLGLAVVYPSPQALHASIPSHLYPINRSNQIPFQETNP